MNGETGRLSDEDVHAWARMIDLAGFDPAPDWSFKQGIPALLNSPEFEAWLASRERAAAEKALTDAAEEVDLSEFYDPDPRGQVSQECGHAETAAHHWLRARAVAVKDRSEG